MSACSGARWHGRADFTDVWFFGMQVTLQDRPDEVAATPARGCRHFGVTLGRAELDAVVAPAPRAGRRLGRPVSTDDEGLATEQTKGKIADPSGNVDRAEDLLATSRRRSKPRLETPRPSPRNCSPTGREPSPTVSAGRDSTRRWEEKA